MSAEATNKDGENDLAILYPERTATIADRVLVMREFSFTESLRHAAPIAALCDAMTAVALDGNLHDLDNLRVAFGQQADAVLQLIAVCSDQPLAWVASLDAQSGEDLMLLWWGVNADFFLRRVLLSVQFRKLRELRTPAGPMSLPTSSPPATTAPGSPATPGDS